HFTLYLVIPSRPSPQAPPTPSTKLSLIFGVIHIYQQVHPRAYGAVLDLRASQQAGQGVGGVVGPAGSRVVPGVGDPEGPQLRGDGLLEALVEGSGGGDELEVVTLLPHGGRELQRGGFDGLGLVPEGDDGGLAARLVGPGETDPVGHVGHAGSR